MTTALGSLVCIPGNEKKERNKEIKERKKEMCVCVCMCVEKCN